ncbi:MAG: hypothetical protein ACOC9Z_00810 [Chloroflexota bacterium]
MKRISRRQFLFFSLSFVASVPLQRIVRTEKSRAPRSRYVQMQGAYGATAYGGDAYGGRTKKT